MCYSYSNSYNECTFHSLCDNGVQNVIYKKCELIFIIYLYVRKLVLVQLVPLSLAVVVVIIVVVVVVAAVPMI
jgi:hypothetical protein